MAAARRCPSPAAGTAAVIPANSRWQRGESIHSHLQFIFTPRETGLLKPLLSGGVWQDSLIYRDGCVWDAFFRGGVLGEGSAGPEVRWRTSAVPVRGAGGFRRGGLRCQPRRRFMGSGEISACFAAGWGRVHGHLYHHLAGYFPAH